MLTVVVEINHMFSTRMAPAGQHRIVFTIIPRVLHQRDWHPGGAHQLLTNGAGFFAAAVVHKYDFMAAGNREDFDLANHGGDRVRTMVKGYDEAESDRRHEVDGAYGDKPNY
jgi:hypothetical protein